jgi:hypothetical protein
MAFNSSAWTLSVGAMHLAPQGTAPLGQPGVQLGEARELALGRLDPDASAAVLHALLHHAFSQPEATLQKSGSTT